MRSGATRAVAAALVATMACGHRQQRPETPAPTQAKMQTPTETPALETASSSIQVGPWSSFAPLNGAEYVALDGDRVAVAGTARIVVWRGQKEIARVEAPAPSPGVPRFDGDRVLWGPGALDLTSGHYELLSRLVPELRPGYVDVSTVHAWSPDGSRVLVAQSAAPGFGPSRVFFADGRTGATLVTLWQQRDALAPTAAWMGRSMAIVGFTDPRVWGLDGAPIARMAVDGGTVNRIDATRDERRVLVTSRDLTLVDTSSWTVLDRWEGRWWDGAISPDGRVAAGIDAGRHLHLARIVGDRFRPDRVVAVDAVKVTLADGRIAVTGAGGALVAPLTVGDDVR